MGSPEGAAKGKCDRPYTIEDAEARLAEVAADPAFARDFFSRYIQGHDVPDYARLLSRAGLILRKPYGGRASWGSVQFEPRGGSIRLLDAPSDSPLYRAGMDVGDELKQADGSRVSSIGDLDGILARHRPGDTVVVAFTDRSDESKIARVTLAEDSRIDVVPVETTGAQLSASQKTFRDRWLR